MNNYPFFITTELLGGIFKVIMGMIVFFNINSFVPDPAEYIIIVMICVYGVISGINNISPYIDEWANKIVQWIGFAIRSKQKVR
jgi:uncharacterized membrane protein HdeD (DUF308 family)